jgi:hypothetical protein
MSVSCNGLCYMHVIDLVRPRRRHRPRRRRRCPRSGPAHRRRRRRPVHRPRATIPISFATRGRARITVLRSWQMKKDLRLVRDAATVAARCVRFLGRTLAHLAPGASRPFLGRTRAHLPRRTARSLLDEPPKQDRGSNPDLAPSRCARFDDAQPQAGGNIVITFVRISPTVQRHDLHSRHDT